MRLQRLPADRLLDQDLRGLANGELIEWTHHRYLRTIQGHKQVREVEVAAAGDLTSWEGKTLAAASYGVPDASLWACLIRDVTTVEAAQESLRALVSTRAFPDGFAAFQAYRPRWHIEDDAYRELKEGWGLEQQRWGRDFAAALGAYDLDVLGQEYPPKSIACVRVSGWLRWRFVGCGDTVNVSWAVLQQ